jgi:cytochrome b pre-mRNA-processing protein 3
MFTRFLRLLFSGSARRREAQELYIALVRQSRNPFLYTECAAPDTLDGRFDLIVLHVFLFLRLPHKPEDRIMRRLLLESLFDDMDRSLREMGVGDMGISRRIKSMSKAAFGRLKAYGDASDTDAALRDALIRNVYRGAPPAPEMTEKLVAYVKKWEQPVAADLLSA